MDYKNKNYMYLNIVFLILSIYVILFPIIIIPLKAIVPSFGICPYFRITGHFCPLCGGTRYIANLPYILENPTYLIHPFGIFVICILFEIIFRIILLFRKNYTKKIIFFDIIYHLILTIFFIIYEITFLFYNT